MLTHAAVTTALISHNTHYFTEHRDPNDFTISFKIWTRLWFLLDCKPAHDSLQKHHVSFVCCKPSFNKAASYAFVTYVHRIHYHRSSLSSHAPPVPCRIIWSRKPFRDFKLTLCRFGAQQLSPLSLRSPASKLMTGASWDPITNDKKTETHGKLYVKLCHIVFIKLSDTYEFSLSLNATYLPCSALKWKSNLKL